MQKSLAAALLLFSFAGYSQATPFSSNSPLGLDVGNLGVSSVGGIVADLVGLNGRHVVSELHWNQLFRGKNRPGHVTIGTQNGFNGDVLNHLGGGIRSAAFRLSLWDGDNASGNYDHNQNDLTVNGINFGSFSDVRTQHINLFGNQSFGGFSRGFRKNLYDTGWFTSHNRNLLDNLFRSLRQNGALAFGLRDWTPNDNYYNFRIGRFGPTIGVQKVPGAVVHPVSAPMSLALLGAGFIGLALTRRRPRRADVSNRSD